MDRNEVYRAAPTKAVLVERIDESWGAIWGVIGAADEDALTRPGEGGWSVKDHLAHLAAWERSLVALLSGEDRTIAAIGGGGDKLGSAIDEINDAIYRRWQSRPLGDVLADLRLGHERLLAVVDPLTDDDLLRSYASYQPNDPAAPADPVVGWVVGNTVGHFDEHLATIRGLLGPAAH